jgi:hypothetical protein
MASFLCIAAPAAIFIQWIKITNFKKEIARAPNRTLTVASASKEP